MPQRLPPWLAVLARRQVNPTRGIPLRSVALGRLPGSLSNEDIGSRRSGGGSRRKKKKQPDTKTPEGVVQRLRDQGFDLDQIEEIVGDADVDSFDPLSPSDWLSGGGDLLTGVLDKLDIPRAAVMSGLVETSDLLSKLPGGRPVKETENLQQTGVSWQDFIQNFNNRVGFADVLEANPDKDFLGMNTENPAVKAGLGFAVDVATDPLNYLGVGLPDDAAKVAQAFRGEGAIAALGKEAADEAGGRVLQRGVTSLGKEELEAVGEKGGLYFKTPGTGVVGRTLKLDKLMGNPERYTTLAKRGTRLGDLATEAAQLTRKATGLNAALRHIGGGAANKGLAGNLGPLRAATRGANDIAKPLDALVTVKSESKARHLAKAFEARLMDQWKGLLASAKGLGVNGQELFHAIGNADNAVAQSEPELVGAFQKFLGDARVEANKLVGRDVIPEQTNYVPRVFTDEMREQLGRPQARGKGGTRSITRKREYLPGTEHTFGTGKNKKTLKLVDPVEDGRSVEGQIEDFLADNDMTQWFKDDALEVMPDYIRKLSGQVRDDYLGQELKRLGVGEDLWREMLDRAPESVGQLRIPRIETGLGRRAYQKLTKQIADAERIVDEFGAKSREARALDWEDLHAKAKQIGSEWEPQIHNALNDIFKQTGERFAQFGTGTALPVDIVGVLRDVGKMAEPGSWRTPLGVHNKLMAMWKKAALLTPGYHWRNSFGGVYMNWLGDVDEGKYAQLERLIANDPDNAPFFRTPIATKPLPSIDDDQLQAGYDEAKRLGVFTGGQSIKEIEKVTEGRWPSLFRGSRRLGGSIENRLRGAMFLDEFVKNGGDGGLALDKVLKYHFDYEALGGMEEKIRQYGIPFYTYTRRSIPLMLEMVVRNPGKINRYFQAKDNIERLSEEEGIVPEYFTRNFAIRLPWMADDSQTYAMPDLPLFSLIEGSDPNQALGQISPAIKTPFELATGKQMWKGIPLEDDPVEIPSAVGFLRPALQAMGRTRTDSEGNETMSERDLYAVMQFLPQIGQYRRLFPSEDKYEERRMTSVLSFLFGVGARTNTDREQANEMWRRYDPYADEIQTNRDLGFETDEARDMAFE